MTLYGGSFDNFMMDDANHGIPRHSIIPTELAPNELAKPVPDSPEIC